MKTINRQVEATIEVTPEELGELFVNSNSEEQIRAFNAMAEAVAKWDNPFCFQVEHIVRHRGLSKVDLTDHARALMSTLGEYANERD